MNRSGEVFPGEADTEKLEAQRLRAFARRSGKIGRGRNVGRTGWLLALIISCTCLIGVAPMRADDACAALIRRIDHVLARAKLTTENAAKVGKLREEGVVLHRSGRHPECEVPLKKAAVLLGLETP